MPRTRNLLTSPNSLSTKDLLTHRIHAALGLYVMCHFLTRFTIFFVGDEDMGLEKASPFRVIVVFSPHLALQISGFAFRLPWKRHPDGNRIWPQYRYEALVFCARCLALMIVASWQKKAQSQNGAPNQSDLVLAHSTRFIIVVATMKAVDYVAKCYQTLQYGSSRTIRDLAGPPGVLYLMSAAQFHATLHSLLTTDRLCVQIAALTVVQTSAFGMTLRRKGIITQPQGLVLYSLVLLLGMTVIVFDLLRQGILCQSIVLGNIAAMVRMDCGMNKYILWTLMAGTTHQISQEYSDNHTHCWCALAIGSTVLLLCSAARRSLQIRTECRRRMISCDQEKTDD